MAKTFEELQSQLDAPVSGGSFIGIDAELRKKEPGELNIAGGIADIGRLAYDVATVYGPAAVAEQFETEDPTLERGLPDILRERAEARAEERRAQLTPEQARERVLPFTDFLTRGDIQQTAESAGTSAVTSLASLAAGAPAAIYGTPLAGSIVASAVGGRLAYKADKNQFTRSLLNAAEAEMQTVKQRSLTREERDQILKDTDKIRGQHALWEAGPEALASAIELTGVGKIISGAAKGLAGRIAAGALTNLGSELATETVTQIGQQQVEAAAGLTEEAPRSLTDIDDFLTSLKEIAPGTVLLTALGGGAATVAGRVSGSVQRRLADSGPIGRVAAQAAPAEAVAPAAPAEAVAPAAPAEAVVPAAPAEAVVPAAPAEAVAPAAPAEAVVPAAPAEAVAPAAPAEAVAPTVTRYEPTQYEQRIAAERAYESHAPTPPAMAPGTMEQLRAESALRRRREAEAPYWAYEPEAPASRLTPLEAAIHRARREVEAYEPEAPVSRLTPEELAYRAYQPVAPGVTISPSERAKRAAEAEFRAYEPEAPASRLTPLEVAIRRAGREVEAYEPEAPVSRLTPEEMLRRKEESAFEAYAPVPPKRITETATDTEVYASAARDLTAAEAPAWLSKEAVSRYKEATGSRSRLTPKSVNRVLEKIQAGEKLTAAQEQTRDFVRWSAEQGNLAVARETLPELELSAAERQMPLEGRAKEVFGTTRNPAEAGYILSSGELLNFSGGQAGRRALTHADIGSVLDTAKEGYGENIREFATMTGAMRLAHDPVGFTNAEIFVAPSRQQVRELKNLITEDTPVRITARKPNGVVEEFTGHGFKARADLASFIERVYGPEYYLASSAADQPVAKVESELVAAFGKKAIDRLIESGILSIEEKAKVVKEKTRRGVIELRARGSYNRSTGLVRMYAETAQPGTAPRTLLHELGVHGGIQEIFGEKIEGIYNDIRKLSQEDSEIGRELKAIYDRQPRVERLLGRADTEALAHFLTQDKYVNSSLWRRIVARVKKWFIETFDIDPSKVLNTTDLGALAASIVRGEVPRITGQARARAHQEVQRLQRIRAAEAKAKEAAPKKKLKQRLEKIERGGKFNSWYSGSILRDGKGDPYRFILRARGKNGKPNTYTPYMIEKDPPAKGQISYIKAVNPAILNSWEVPSEAKADPAGYYANLGHDAMLLADRREAISLVEGGVKSVRAIPPAPKVATLEDAKEMEFATEDTTYDQPFYDSLKAPGVRDTAKRETRNALLEIGKTIDKFLGSLSTRVAKIDQETATRLRKLDFDIGIKTNDAKSKVEALYKKAKKMPKRDYLAFDVALKNRDIDKRDALAKQYGFEAELKEVRDYLEEVRQRALDRGLEIRKLDEYWPRVLKDKIGFLRHFQRGDDWPVISNAIKKRERELGFEPGELPDDQRAEIIDNYLLGHGHELSSPGARQRRTVAKIDSDLLKYYMTSEGAIMSYIYEMENDIAARSFFGKSPQKVRALRKALRLAEARLRGYQKELDEAKTPAAEKQIRNKINRSTGTKKKIESYLAQFHRGDNTDSIGTYINKLLTEKRIRPEQERELHDMLSARFNQIGTRGIFTAYKNLAYIDTMGSPISAITQLGDLAFSLYEAGAIRTGKNVIKSIVGRPLVSRQEVGVDRIAAELEDEGVTAKWVNNVFKVVGLDKMDAIGKETLMSAAVEKAQKRSRGPKAEQFRKELQPVFGKDTDGLMRDLQSGDITENVLFYAWSKLMDYQPGALSEMPQGYLEAGNGRLFYMLKSFTLKQFDIFRREAFQNITEGTKQKDSKRVSRGIKNLITLGTLFVLGNAAADEIKDWVLGRPTDLEDRAVDNILRLFGVGKFVTWQARQDGIGSAAFKQIAPPFKFLDALTRDIISGGEKGFETVGSIPLVGKLYYWRYGKGFGKRESLIEIKFRKQQKKLRELQKDFDAAEDKAAFRAKNHEELARAARGRRVQSSVNKLTARYNKAEGRPRAQERILERRAAIMERFLGGT